MRPRGEGGNVPHQDLGGRVMMKSVLGVAGLCALMAAGAVAAQPMPERRGIGMPDVDLFGGDLRSIYGTSQPICEATCLAEPSCAAFTFNLRANACFLKSDAVTPKPFAGAISARIVETPPAALARAEALAAALDGIPVAQVDAARQLAQRIGLGNAPALDTEEALLTSARAAEQGGDTRAAIMARLQALNLNDAAESWLAVARLALGTEDTDDYSVTRADRELAASAALNAYLALGHARGAGGGAGDVRRRAGGARRRATVADGAAPGARFGAKSGDRGRRSPAPSACSDFACWRRRRISSRPARASACNSPSRCGRRESTMRISCASTAPAIRSRSATGSSASRGWSMAPPIVSTCAKGCRRPAARCWTAP